MNLKMNRMHKVLLAVLSGVLVSISFPTLVFGIHFPNLGLLGWVALVPLFVVVSESRPRNAFIYTFITALVLYSTSLFWLYKAIHGFGGLSIATSMSIMFLLFLLLSSITALAPLFARLIQTRWRGELIVLLPVCWAAIELLGNYIPFGGFPWSNIAMGQYRMLPMIQIVDLVGIYGFIFAMIWVNAYVMDCVIRVGGGAVKFLLPKTILTVAMIVGMLTYGYITINAVQEEYDATKTIQVGLIQGNIPQAEKWLKDKAVRNLDIHRNGVVKLTGNVDLIIWPEASFPWPVKDSMTLIDPLTLGFPDGYVGVTPYVMLGAIADRTDELYYNSAILFDAQGRVRGMHHKSHLVPFGEYVPYEKALFFAKKLAEPIGNFVSGESNAPLVAGDARVGALICYEDVFPEIGARLAAAGANLLVNITNDAWYGVTSAPYQHLALSVFRAVESRRVLLRATNTGISAVIDPTGRVQMESGLFEPAILVSNVGLMERVSTYAALGDWFAIACSVYMLFGIGMVIVMRIGRRV
jgi:apolipoprotein N-acyltransferase